MSVCVLVVSSWLFFVVVVVCCLFLFAFSLFYLFLSLSESIFVCFVFCKKWPRLLLFFSPISSPIR